MKQLSLPTYSFRVSERDGVKLIFDQQRKKWVKLTPEEWVRQHFVQYLIHEGKYPPGLIGIEMILRLNSLSKRVDILVHDRKGNPVMIVECKSPDIAISNTYEDKVYGQIGEYNMKYSLSYVVVTNGIVHYAFRYNGETNQYEHLLEIPLYDELQ